MRTACDCTTRVLVCFCACVCAPDGEKTTSYHAVHGKVVVLGLQLYSMLVVPSDLCVTGEKKALVVQDPVEHLQTEKGKKMQMSVQNALQIKRVFPSVCSQQLRRE